MLSFKIVGCRRLEICIVLFVAQLYIHQSDKKSYHLLFLAVALWYLVSNDKGIGCI